MTNQFDASVLQWVSDNREAWLTVFFTVITMAGSVPAIAVMTVCAASVAIRAGRRWDAAAAIATMVTAWMLMVGLKLLAARERPPAPFTLVELSTYAFPSGHAMLSAALAVIVGAIAVRNRALWPLLVAASALIGISRVYLGAHWPTDILAGWLIGTVWAVACMALAHALQPTDFRVTRRHSPR